MVSVSIVFSQNRMVKAFCFMVPTKKATAVFWGTKLNFKDEKETVLAPMPVVGAVTIFFFSGTLTCTIKRKRGFLCVCVKKSTTKRQLKILLPYPR